MIKVEFKLNINSTEIYYRENEEQHKSSFYEEIGQLLKKMATSKSDDKTAEEQKTHERN